MIKFQQESGPDHTQPWSVVVGDDASIIHGRPDADYLTGFGPKGRHEITVFWKDALKDPARAVGLVPTFTGAGEMFSVDLEVREAAEYVVDDEGLARLRESETRMRDALS